MPGGVTTAEVEDDLDRDVVVVADDRQVGDADPGAATGIEQGVQRAAGGEPRAPVDEAYRAVAEDGCAEVRGFAIHGGGVARGVLLLTPAAGRA